MECELCPNEATQKHHIMYFPEVTIAVCDECHLKIHNGEFPDLIQYNTGDAKLFYGQSKRLRRWGVY